MQQHNTYTQQLSRHVTDCIHMVGLPAVLSVKSCVSVGWETPLLWERKLQHGTPGWGGVGRRGR